MKKLLSLSLAAIMLLVTFSGCDALSTLQNLLDPTEPARTTVTEEEWLAALDCSNYTVNGSASYSNANGEKLETDTIYAKVTGHSFYRHQTSGIGTNKTEKKDYYIIIDNVNYQLVETESGYVANQVNAGYANEKFGDVFGASADMHAIFACLTYNAEAKNYTGKYITDGNITYTIVVTFVDGQITSADIQRKSGTLEITYNVYSFGSTVVDLPEYTVAP